MHPVQTQSPRAADRSTANLLRPAPSLHALGVTRGEGGTECLPTGLSGVSQTTAPSVRPGQTSSNSTCAPSALGSEGRAFPRAHVNHRQPGSEQRQPLAHTLWSSASFFPAHISFTIRYHRSHSVFRLASKTSFLDAILIFKVGIRRSRNATVVLLTSCRGREGRGKCPTPSRAPGTGGGNGRSDMRERQPSKDHGCALAGWSAGPCTGRLQVQSRAGAHT